MQSQSSSDAVALTTGRDVWVFARQDGEWLAVWRTMLDAAEQPA